jgi:hypothetical protein
MKRGYIGLAMGVMVALGAFLSLPSCGHDQKVVSITITPTSFTFLSNIANQTGEQYTATATYIHPPVTKDVTKQATWTVDNQIVSMNAGYVVPVGGVSCGGGTITATLPEGTGGAGNIVSGYATVTVDDPEILQCPGGGTVATLSVGVVGSGLVTSTPAGISCPGTCIASYDVGASVLLTASDGTFSSWTNCTAATQSAAECTVTIASGGTAVVANFN